MRRTSEILTLCLLIALLDGVVSCQRSKTPDIETTTEKTTTQLPKKLPISRKIQREFPLLPLIEKQRWAELLRLESIAKHEIPSPLTQEQISEQIQKLSQNLQQLHPFSQNEQTITLGGVSYNQLTGQVELMAKVNDLSSQQKGDQEDIEVILCTSRGRQHESLFVTKIRPLHLEILLHLAGFSKDKDPSKFQIFIALPSQDPIPIRDLLQDADGHPLPQPMLWEFVGSPFTSSYQPDLNGDLIIAWHAHDSVLRTTHKKIANNQIKLRAKPHTALKPNTAVKLLLVPSKK